MKDPPRLVEGGDGPPELAELLTAARADLPSKAELAAVAAATPGLGAGAGIAGVTVGGPKVVFGLIAACGLSAAGIYGLAKNAAPLQVERSSAPIVTAPQSSAPEPAPAKATAAPIPAPTVAPSASTARAPTAAAPAAPPGPSESDLLGKARSVLRSDPTRALALAREHGRRYPKGALAQEREVILIEALERSGRRDEASKRAEAFGKQYPSSAHAPKVKAVTETP